MFYYLYHLKNIFFPLNVLHYITFRAAYAAVTSLLLAFLFGNKIISFLKRKGIGEKISPYIQGTHQQKEGTPTMGGIIILISLFISVILWGDLSNRFIHYALFTMLYLGGAGIVDDWLKIKKNKGLAVWHKLVIQTVLCIVIGYLIIRYPLKDGYTTKTSLLFLKNAFLNLGYFYIPFMILVMVGTSNAVNLSDGLDGLAIGLVGIASAALIFLSYITGHIKIAHYLNILYIDGAGEMSVVAAGMVGASLGFLWFNAYPANVFMGDTGALMLGGLLGLNAVLIKQEILLILVGGVFVVEALSVLIQVSVFKITKKRKRVFLITPIHHHFQKRGWAEPKVVVRFWILEILFVLIALSTLKIR